VFRKINRMVFLDKDRIMGNVQKHNICMVFIAAYKNISGMKRIRTFLKLSVAMQILLWMI
jgi:hypothetical protein